MTTAWIAIRGPAFVSDVKAECSVSDEVTLRAFDGISDPEAFPFADVLSVAHAHDITGGVVAMVWVQKLGLQVECRFHTPSALHDDVTLQLVHETLNQWRISAADDDVTTAIAKRAAPKRKLALSLWDEGSSYSVLSSWWKGARALSWEVASRDGQPVRRARFLP